MIPISDLKYWNIVKQSIAELRLPGTVESFIELAPIGFLSGLLAGVNSLFLVGLTF